MNRDPHMQDESQTDDGNALLSRRNMIVGAAATAVAATVALAASNRSIARRSGGFVRWVMNQRLRPASLATAEMEHWMAEVGADFEIGFTRMRLVGVQPLPLVGDRPEGLRRRPFVAIFDLPQGESYPGNIVHRVHNARYPAFDIFFAEPTLERLNRMTAVFN